MNSRAKILAQGLARTRRVAIVAYSLLFLAGLSIFVLVLGLPVPEDREAFGEVRDDFAATWCGTWGVNPEDPAADEWRLFVERNEAFVRENSDYLFVSTGWSSGGEVKKDMITWTIEEYELFDFPIEEYWFSYGFPQYFTFFEFGDSYGPPNC
jgi:hypothetical protein